LETPKTTDISVVSPKENIPHKYATGTQNIATTASSTHILGPIFGAQDSSDSVT